MISLNPSFATRAPLATVLIPLLGGAVFLSERIQTLLQGAGPWSIDAMLAAREGREA